MPWHWVCTRNAPFMSAGKLLRRELTPEEVQEFEMIVKTVKF